MRAVAADALIALNLTIEVAFIALTLASLTAAVQVGVIAGLAELLLADQGLRRWNLHRKEGL